LISRDDLPQVHRPLDAVAMRDILLPLIRDFKKDAFNMTTMRPR
jgi:hypothetical protein